MPASFLHMTKQLSYFDWPSNGASPELQVAKWNFGSILCRIIDHFVVVTDSAMEMLRVSGSLQAQAAFSLQ